MFDVGKNKNKNKNKRRNSYKHARVHVLMSDFLPLKWCVLVNERKC